MIGISAFRTNCISAVTEIKPFSAEILNLNVISVKWREWLLSCTIQLISHPCVVVQRPYNRVILHLLLRRLLCQDLRRRRALRQHPLYIQDL